MITGIDTNHHHPITNPAAVKDWLLAQNGGDNPGFDMTRLGYSSRSGKGGLIVDKQALKSLKNWNDLGVPCGAYVACYDASPEAARSTIRQAMEVLENFKLEYPVAYDMEYWNSTGKPGGYEYAKKENREKNTDIMLAALQEIEAHGYYAMVYCSRDFYLNYLNRERLKAYDVWEAAYPNDNSQVANGMHQYSSKGRVPGISGDVDLNHAKKDYRKIIREAGLNVPANAAQPEPVKIYTLTIGPMSEGDRDTMAAEAKRLRLAVKESAEEA